jgi:hypothetical protein
MEVSARVVRTIDVLPTESGLLGALVPLDLPVDVVVVLEQQERAR